jgi:predicted PurR-regulated permease PerM
VAAISPEPGRATPGPALAWLAAAALLVIAWLSHLFATGLLLGALMGFTLQPVYERLARWSRRPVLASVVTVLATGLVIVGAVVGFSDYVIRPRLVGDEEMPVLLTFLALFGGLEVIGLAGLIAGPVIMALAVAVLRLYAREAGAGGKKPRDRLC